MKKLNIQQIANDQNKFLVRLLYASIFIITTGISVLFTSLYHIYKYKCKYKSKSNDKNKEIKTYLHIMKKKVKLQ